MIYQKNGGLRSSHKDCWKDEPNITATSLADDYVHYSQPRVLTVREWARLQMFPDWYEFRGPRTTGGRRRAGDPDAGIWDRDVPCIHKLVTPGSTCKACRVSRQTSGWKVP